MVIKRRACSRKVPVLNRNRRGAVKIDRPWPVEIGPPIGGLGRVVARRLTRVAFDEPEERRLVDDLILHGRELDHVKGLFHCGGVLGGAT